MAYFLDLFAGIGGFRLGSEWAGLRFDRHFYSEVDPYACKVYAARFPEAEALGDIRAIKGVALPRGDWIIAGGFPCQDISVAGKGAGLSGERSGLWYEYARIIGELRPRYAIMENVGALAFRGLDSVLGSLAALGYDAEWQDIRASDVGAPHRRERIWIVAHPMLDGWEPRGTECPGLEGRPSPIEPGVLSDTLGDGVRNEPGRRDGQAWTDTPEPRDNDAQGTLADAEQDRRGFFRNENRNLSGEVREKTNINSRCSAGRAWWATEPDVGRVAHGIPSRVDRLKCLGNSIVPQIAELIFRQAAFDEWRV
jgi:DNA (cytosine-5)-methyltransferase 1